MTKEEKLLQEIERLKREGSTLSKRRDRLRWSWLPMLLIVPAAWFGGLIIALITALATFSYFGVTAYIVYVRRFAIQQEIKEIRSYIQRLHAPPREPRPLSPLGSGLNRYRRES